MLRHFRKWIKFKLDAFLSPYYVPLAEHREECDLMQRCIRRLEESATHWHERFMSATKVIHWPDRFYKIHGEGIDQPLVAEGILAIMVTLEPAKYLFHFPATTRVDIKAEEIVEAAGLLATHAEEHLFPKLRSEIAEKCLEAARDLAFAKLKRTPPITHCPSCEKVTDLPKVESTISPLTADDRRA